MAARKTAAKKPASKQNKTQETKASVDTFLAGVADARQRKDAGALCELMARATGEKPAMWGSSIVGFGSYHYVYESGREGDAPLAGFSPRKAALVLYVKGGFPRHEELLGKLGKFKTGTGCLYVKALDDVDAGTLETLVRLSTQWTRQQHA